MSGDQSAEERGWWTLGELLEPWQQRVPRDAAERAGTSEDAEDRQDPKQDTESTGESPRRR